MPICEFFAAGADHRAVLEYLLARGECDIYQNTFPAGQLPQTLQSLADFESRFGICDWETCAVETMYLQLHVREAGGRAELQRREDPRKGTFDYTTAGWGLVQLYLECPGRGRLCASYTNHNSEKRAHHMWGDGSSWPELGDPAAWHWPMITAFSRRLNRFIQNLAVGKDGFRFILPQAAAMHEAGLPFL